MVRVKICGITRLSDALAAVEAGADAVGFVFAKSPRKVSEAGAKAIASSLGPWVTKVGVFVNEKPVNIVRTMRRCGLDAVQLHGDEPATEARGLRAMGYTVIKAVRVGGKLDARAIEAYPADAVLLDTASPDVYGGTGKKFDWKLLKGLRLKKPVIVSGGLKPGNVKGLLKSYKPYGVDVSSGVESSPGKKDQGSVRKFIKNAKSL